MDSPRSGRRRAAAASWALVGIGIGGVAGASTIAYTDTMKATVTEAPVANLPTSPDITATTETPPRRLVSPSYSPHVTVSRGS